jgi:hypothetical protein
VSRASYQAPARGAWPRRSRGLPREGEEAEGGPLRYGPRTFTTAHGRRRRPGRRPGRYPLVRALPPVAAATLRGPPNGGGIGLLTPLGPPTRHIQAQPGGRAVGGREGGVCTLTGRCGLLEVRDDPVALETECSAPPEKRRFSGVNTSAIGLPILEGSRRLRSGRGCCRLAWRERRDGPAVWRGDSGQGRARCLLFPTAKSGGEGDDRGRVVGLH